MKKYLRHSMTLFDKVDWIVRLSAEAIGVSDKAIIKGANLYRSYNVDIFELMIRPEKVEEAKKELNSIYDMFINCMNEVNNPKGVITTDNQ